MTQSRLILLSGIPASGKSTYGEWLAREKGFIHLDVEHGVLQRAGLKELWDRIFTEGISVAPFIEGVRQFAVPVAIDWGFPPQCLPTVRAFHQHGVATWWFDGDREAARRAFIRRGTVSVADLDVQMRLIAERWAEITSFFGTRVINTINRDVTYIPPEQIFQHMTRSPSV